MADFAKELRAAMRGVTPGPWYQTGAPWFSSGDGVLAGSPDGNIAFLIADCDNFAIPRDEYEGPFPLGDQEADAAYIAACSPDRIASVLDALDAAHKRIAALEAALAAMEPHIRQINGCARINDEMGRVVHGQTEAARELFALFEALPSRIDKEDRNGRSAQL